jgi:hypothetical protein
MEKFDFLEIRFESLKAVIYLAMEELHFEYNSVVKGYGLFKNSKGEDVEFVVPFRQNITESRAKAMQIKQWKDQIKKTAIEQFQKKYGKSYDKKVHMPDVIYLESINDFNPAGFKDSTYDDLCETITSEALWEKLQAMKSGK